MADSKYTPTRDLTNEIEHLFMPTAERLSELFRVLVESSSPTYAAIARQGLELVQELHNDLDVRREALVGAA